jgi:hypothetical protein
MAPVFGEIASTSVGGVSPTPTWRPAIITTTIIGAQPGHPPMGGASIVERAPWRTFETLMAVVPTLGSVTRVSVTLGSVTLVDPVGCWA